jgi:hypothetical protein
VFYIEEAATLLSRRRAGGFAPRLKKAEPGAAPHWDNHVLELVQYLIVSLDKKKKHSFNYRAQKIPIVHLPQNIPNKISAEIINANMFPKNWTVETRV